MEYGYLGLQIGKSRSTVSLLVEVAIQAARLQGGMSELEGLQPLVYEEAYLDCDGLLPNHLLSVLSHRL